MEKGLRRYVMVDPLVSEEVPRGERTALLHDLSRQYNVSVSTLKRYRKRYEKERLDGLLPKERRADKGKSRRIPEEILQKAVELREEVRTRATEQIIAILDRLYPAHKGQIKRSTLARHFKQLGKTRQALRKESKSYRRFQKRHRNDLWETDICLPSLQVRDEDGQVRQAVLWLSSTTPQGSVWRRNSMPPRTPGWSSPASRKPWSSMACRRRCISTTGPSSFQNRSPAPVSGSVSGISGPNPTTPRAKAVLHTAPP